MQKFLNKIFVLVYCLLVFGQDSYAVIFHLEGNRYFYTFDEKDLITALQLIEAEHNLDQEQDNSLRKAALKDSNYVLLLSDGFKCNDQPLASTLKDLVNEEAVVIKTGIDCTISLEEVGSKDLAENNVISFRQDNCKPLPFKENSIDTVLARRTLCHCAINREFKYITCGGLDMRSEANAMTLLSSVAKSLNKNNPNGYAFINGWHQGGWGVKKIHKQELKSQEIFDKIIDQLKLKYPNLEIRMIYIYKEESSLLLSIAVSSDSSHAVLVPAAFAGIQMKVISKATPAALDTRTSGRAF